MTAPKTSPMNSEPRFPVTNKVWGFEELIVNEPLYCAKYLNIAPGGTSSLHYHKSKTETFIVLSGVCWLTHKTKLSILFPGEKRRIGVYDLHRFAVPLGFEPCRILEVSTHDEAADSYRLKPSSMMEARGAMNEHSNG